MNVRSEELVDAQVAHALTDAAVRLLLKSVEAGGNMAIEPQEHAARAELEHHHLILDDDRFSGPRLEVTDTGHRIADVLRADIATGGRRNEVVRHAVLQAAKGLKEPLAADAALLVGSGVDPSPTDREVASATTWLHAKGLIEVIECAELTLVATITPLGEDALYSGQRLSSVPSGSPLASGSTQHLSVIGDNATVAVSQFGSASARAQHSIAADLAPLRAQILKELTGTDQSTAIVLVEDLENAVLVGDAGGVRKRGQVVLSFLEKFGPALLNLAAAVVKAVEG